MQIEIDFSQIYEDKVGILEKKWSVYSDILVQLMRTYLPKDGNVLTLLDACSDCEGMIMMNFCCTLY